MIGDSFSVERTKNYLRQIKGTVVFRAAAVLVSFLYLPIMIRYLGQDQFGIWATLLSIVSWVLFFDLGVGNGVRNKVSESLAKNDLALAQKYIASGYSLIGIVIAVLWTVFMIASFFTPWQYIFNTKLVSEASIRNAVQVTLTCVLLNFWLGLIGSVLSALQLISRVALGQFLTNVLALVFVYALSIAGKASLPQMALAYGISLVIGNLFLNIWLYRSRRDLRPKWCLDRQHIRPLIALGAQFFVIQIAVLIIFTTDKILITQIFGPKYVTPYETLFKLFGVVTLAHAVISAPLWSAYTEAYQRGDFNWISSMMTRQKKLYLGVVVFVIILSLSAKNIISIWVGEDVEVSTELVISVAIFVLVSTWNNIFAMLVNGVGKMHVQLLTAIVAMIINIPLALLFTKVFEMNVSGVVLATCISLSLASIALPIQVRRILAENKVNTAS